MRATIFFADQGHFNGLPFSKWFEGNADDRLLLLPDKASVNVPDFQAGGENPQVTFRLHNSSASEVKKSQREFILKKWKDAQELRSFSHYEPIVQKIRGLTGLDQSSREFKSCVSEIVQGASNEFIREQLDHLAAVCQLRILRGRDPEVNTLKQKFRDQLKKALPEQNQNSLEDPTSEKLAELAMNYLG